jgi:hypothetical protein
VHICNFRPMSYAKSTYELPRNEAPLLSLVIFSPFSNTVLVPVSPLVKIFQEVALLHNVVIKYHLDGESRGIMML